MKAEEKAKDLFVMVYEAIPNCVIEENHIASELAKQCAVICVNEIIKSRPSLPSPNAVESIDECLFQAREYWSDVKEEIRKL